MSKKFRRPQPIRQQVGIVAPQQNSSTPVQTLANQLNIADASASIAAIEKKRTSRVICLTYNDQPPGGCVLAFAVTSALQPVLSEMGKVPKLDLILRTTGGAAELPWGIVSLLREFSDELGVIVSGFALSGGCHIAIAADDLVMGPFSMLGPVDPTRNHPLLPKDAKGEPIPTSVQDLKHCIQFIREQLGENYAQQNLALIVSELFKYINPLALGALEQTYNLSRLITRKVLGTRRVKLRDEQVDKIVEILSGQFYSHAFLISREDVEKELGLSITRPDDELLRLMANLETQYLTEFQKAVPAAPNTQDPLVYVGGLLQTTGMGLAIAVVKKKDGTLVADSWLKFR
jgi:hypothetical protein